MKFKVFIFILSYIACWPIFAQSSQQIQLNFSYGLDLPGGDLKDRFGFDFNPGIDLDYVHNEKWFFGLHGHFILGNRVKEDVIAPIRINEGYIVSQLKSVSVVSLKQRAYLVGVHSGRFINLSKSDFQHGPRIRIGINMISHHIIYNDESAATIQFSGSYGSGYDRLTRGIGVEEFIGYQYISKSKLINVYGGFNLVQTFTKSIRPIDFDTGEYGGDNRKDLLNGFRLGISFKLFETGESEEIYY